MDKTFKKGGVVGTSALFYLYFAAELPYMAENLAKMNAFLSLGRSKLAMLASLLALTTLSACGAAKPWYNKRLRSEVANFKPVEVEKDDFQLLLIGDCGKVPEGEMQPVFVKLQEELSVAGKNSGIIYLGDNIYEYGLTAPDAPDRAEMERRMTAQLRPTENYEGRVLVIPGNHDWAQGKPEGLAARLREEEFVEAHLQRGEEAYLPNNGCPGPDEIVLTDNAVLLVFDSQWWLHKHEKPGKAQGCDATTDEEFLANVKAALQRNEGKEIIVAAHHPLHSYGPHGGHFHPSNHLFPMRMFKHNLWIPLPVLGTVAVVYRKYFGNIQDIPNRRYTQLQTELDALFAKYPDLIYVSGHDHNLQYLPQEGRHYIVSGSGVKSTYVSHGKNAAFTDAEQGFAKLVLKQEGAIWLEFWAENPKTNQMQLRFSQQIK